MYFGFLAVLAVIILLTGNSMLLYGYALLSLPGFAFISVAGLPCVLTTPVHGVAYDIVDKGCADTQGVANAIYLAIDIYKAREEYAELTKNPLKRYDVGGDKRESDLNVEQIAGVSENH